MKIKILAGGLLSVLLAAGITKVTYRMILDAPVNVHDSGAAGDGSTDDSAAIQKAINAATAGGIVYFPASNYKACGLTLPNDGVALVGAGKFATIITATNSTCTVFKSSNQSITRSYIRIANMAINGTGAGNTGVGVDFSGVSDSVMENVYVADFGTQLMLNAAVAGNTLYDSYYHCEFRANLASSGLVGVQALRFANAQKFYATKFHRLATQFLIGDINAANPNEIDCYGCSFESADTVSVNIVRGQSLHFFGGRFEADPIGVQTAADNLIRNVVVDSPHFSGTIPTPINDLAGAIAIRGGNAYELAYFRGASTYAGPNLVPNSRMEGWNGAATLLGWASLSTSNWATTGSVAQESVTVHSGSFSVKGGSGAAVNTGVATANKIPVYPARPYTLTFWWTTPASTAKLRYAFRLFDSSGSVITTGTITGVNSAGDPAGFEGATSLSYSGGYNAFILPADITPASSGVMERQTYVAMFPANTAAVQLGWFVGTTTTTSFFFYLDDVYFSEGSALIYPQAAPLTDSGDQTVNGNLSIGPKTFANLGAPANGSLTYCSDCTVANPCAGAGTGALAKRLNGAWVCN